MLLFSSFLMEFAAVSSKGICIDDIQGSTELSPTGYMFFQEIFNSL